LAFNSSVIGLSKTAINLAIEEEGKMRAQDRLAVETAEAKNAVESYVLDMRKKIADDKEYGQYATETEKEDFSRVSYQIEDWLYDEGDDVSKGVYNQKLAELKKYADPVVNRKIEDRLRTTNAAQLRDAINHYRTELTNAKYDHIEAEEKAKIAAECNRVEQNLQELLNKQQALPKTSNPIFHASELITKKKELEKLANPILSKPKPAPPPPPTTTPAEAPKTEAAPNEQPPVSDPQKTADVDMADAPN